MKFHDSSSSGRKCSTSTEDFHLQAVYSEQLHQITIRVTITDATSYSSHDRRRAVKLHRS
jgi:hypothetical protein